MASGTTGGGSSVLPQGAGIIPRALHHVFAAAEELRGEGWSVTLQATMVEIYNETLRDLLLAGGTNAQLDIRHDKDGVTSVTNLTTVEVTDQAAVSNDSDSTVTSIAPHQSACVALPPRSPSCSVKPPRTAPWVLHPLMHDPHAATVSSSSSSKVCFVMWYCRCTSCSH